MNDSRPGSRPSARIAWEFFKVGCVAFGGFLAVISVIESVFTRRLGWVRQERMLDGVSLASVLPGPQAVNVAAYVGYGCGGLRGAVAAVIGVLAPAYVLVTGFTFLYFGLLRDAAVMSGFFLGLIPAVVAVIFTVALRMGSRCLGGALTWSIALCAAALTSLSPGAISVWMNLGMFAAAAALGWKCLQPSSVSESPVAPLALSRVLGLLIFPVTLATLYLVGPPLDPNGVPQLGLTFAGLGVLLFGGGYVFIPFIMDAVVEEAGWLSAAEFSDGIAFSQMTPGPVVICAAFIGQKVAMEQHGPLWGLLGGLVATVAIFGPPAMLMIAASQVLDHVKSSPRAQGALRGVRAAVVGMIAAAGVVILRSAMPSDAQGSVVLDAGLWTTALILALSLVALLRFKLMPTLVIPAAGLLGLLLC